MTKHITNAKGFTLIEVIVVLSLISIFSAIAAPSLARTERRELQRAASDIKHDLRYAQRMSLLTANTHYLIFDIQGGSYTVRRIGPYEHKEVREVQLPPTVGIFDINSYPIPGIIGFTPRGTPRNPCTIRLETARYNIYLTVNVSGGRIRVGNITENASRR